MSEVREIGIEKECFLMQGKKIMEPQRYGFPFDEFEFLVELRSLPSDRAFPVITTLAQEELQNSLRAGKFNMILDDTPNRNVDNRWVKAHWDKYNLHRFDNQDLTQNIYASSEVSHHQGVIPCGERSRLTAGIHVHFSSRDSKTGDVIELPVKEIVGAMDDAFRDDIEVSLRNLGEWEPKIHGFEYRSLPSNMNIKKVVQTAFKILRSV